MKDKLKEMNVKWDEMNFQDIGKIMILMRYKHAQEFTLEVLLQEILVVKGCYSIVQ